MKVTFRSILAVALAFVVALFISVAPASAAKSKKPQTYTSDRLADIQTYAADIEAMRQRLPELQTLIQNEDWIFTRNFLHGPLGELRIKMLYLSRNLAPDVQSQANQLAKAVGTGISSIDQAAQSLDYRGAVRSYAETVRDLDSFMNLVPRG